MRKAAKGDTPGSALARKILGEEPDFPEEFDHMVEWIYMLHGRSGATMSGIAPLSYATVDGWIKLMDIQDVEPYHVEALMILDAAMLADPEKVEKEEEGFDDDGVVEPRVFAPWPEKKK